MNTTADVAYLLLTQCEMATNPELQAHLRAPLESDIHLTAAIYAERTQCAPLDPPVFGVRPHLKFWGDVEEVIQHARDYLGGALIGGWQPPYSTAPF